MLIHNAGDNMIALAYLVKEDASNLYNNGRHASFYPGVSEISDVAWATLNEHETNRDLIDARLRPVAVVPPKADMFAVKLEPGAYARKAAKKK